MYFGNKLPFSQFNTTVIDKNNPTNNIMELSGILYIFKILSENTLLFKDFNLVIVTDSLYSINCITVWSDNWIKNNWKTSKNDLVKNKDLIQEILKYQIKCNNVEFKFIKAHQSEPNINSIEHFLWYGNNYVDTNINKVFKFVEK